MKCKSGGREFDLSVPHEANTYLRQKSTVTWDGKRVTAVNSQVFIERQVSNANAIRDTMAKLLDDQNNNLPPQMKKMVLEPAIQQCVQPYNAIACIAESAERQYFAEIPDQQLEKLVEHACQVLDRLSSCPKWTMTGILQGHDQALLSAVTNCSRNMNFIQVAAALNNDTGRSGSGSGIKGKKNLLESLAAFSGACTGRVMPCEYVGKCLRGVVVNFRSILVMERNTPNEEIYQTLEASGILGQFLRLVTLPEATDSSTPMGMQASLLVLDEISQCTDLVNSKFKVSKAPTGVILNAVVVTKEDGYRGGPVHPAISERLLALQKMANKICCAMCGKCAGDDVSLLICSRCNDTKYCGAECQRADWKKHKRICKKPRN